MTTIIVQPYPDEAAILGLCLITNAQGDVAVCGVLGGCFPFPDHAHLSMEACMVHDRRAFGRRALMLEEQDLCSVHMAMLFSGLALDFCLAGNVV